MKPCMLCTNWPTRETQTGFFWLFPFPLLFLCLQLPDKGKRNTHFRILLYFLPQKEKRKYAMRIRFFTFLGRSKEMNQLKFLF